MSKATIHAPVEDFTGKVGSVAFADGVGTLELPSTELSYFIRHGYKVEVEKSAKAAPAKSDAGSESGSGQAPAPAKKAVPAKKATSAKTAASQPANPQA